MGRCSSQLLWRAPLRSRAGVDGTEPLLSLRFPWNGSYAGVRLRMTRRPPLAWSLSRSIQAARGGNTGRETDESPIYSHATGIRGEAAFHASIASAELDARIDPRPGGSTDRSTDPPIHRPVDQTGSRSLALWACRVKGRRA